MWKHERRYWTDSFTYPAPGVRPVCCACTARLPVRIWRTWRGVHLETPPLSILIRSRNLKNVRPDRWRCWPVMFQIYSHSVQYLTRSLRNRSTDLFVTNQWNEKKGDASIWLIAASSDPPAYFWCWCQVQILQQINITAQHATGFRSDDSMTSVVRNAQFWARRQF